jgi:hypothetical protein
MGEPEDLVPFVTSRSLEFGIGVASAGDAPRDGSISTRCAPSEGGWPDDRPLSSVHMGPIQFGSSLSHKHYRGRKHIASRALCPLRPGGLSAPACSENVVQHQSNNLSERARLGARREARILAFTPHPPSLALAGSTHSFAQHGRSPLQLICHCALTRIRPIQVALTLGRIASKLPTVTSTSRDTHRSAPDSSSPGRPTQRRPHSFLLFSLQHRAWCSRRRYISSRPAVASGVSRTKCGGCGNDY